MKAQTKGLILGGSAIALVALGCSLLRSMSEEGSAGAPRAASARGAAARSAGDRAISSRRWDAGTTYVYELESSRALVMHGDQGAGQPRTLALSGRLSISVVGPAEDGILLRLALDANRPAGAGAAALLDASARLSGAFYAVAEPTGKLVSFSFPRGLGGTERATLKGLASTLQLVVSEPGAASWRTTEQDASGEYEAAYEASGRGIHKAKERFVRARGPRGLTPIKDPSSYAVTSSIDFELDASGWPRSASEDETLAVTASAMRIEAKSRTIARLASIEQTADLARRVAAEQGALEREAEADVEGFAAARRRADEGLIDGASYQALLGELADADVKLRNRAMARLAALFRVRPEEAARAADSILRGAVGGEPAKRLIGALGGAGTAQAQQALASVLGADGAAAETRGDAAAALGMTKHPTAGSKQALLAASASSDREVSSTATLGLGNLARRMNEEAGDTADAIAALIRGLEGATDDAERVLYLDALGNSGDARALSAIEPYLAHAEVRVRTAAVEALRFMAGVEQRIVTALGDHAAEVRRAAAGTLTYRAITPLRSLVALVLQKDPDVSTRLELVNAIRLRKRQEPALVDLLAWSAANDPVAEVKNAAKGALGG